MQCVSTQCWHEVQFFIFALCIMHSALKSAVKCPFEYKLQCKAVCKVHYNLVQFSVDQEIHNLCECCPQKAEGIVYLFIFEYSHSVY